jgi:flagellar basal-body rod modification protein FlgD
MTSTVDALAVATTDPAGQSPQPNGNTDSSQLATKDEFLKLLVAQIRNQNPLDPADSVQFVTQLAQFSELEQMIAIRQDLDGICGGLGSSTSPSGEGQSGATAAA